MKKLLSLTIAIIIGLAATSSFAATIVYGPAVTISADANVISTDIVGAYNFSSDATNSTVNGVSFTDVTASTGTTGDVTLANFGGNVDSTFSNSGQANTPTFGTLGADFQAVLGGGLFGNDAAMDSASITLNNLSPGTQYQVQIFANRTTDPNLRTIDIDGVTLISNANTADLIGQYTIGNFTADAATQSLGSLAGSSNFGVLNAIVVSTVVPEPSTYAITFGLIAVAIVAIRRRKTNQDRE
ncbi:PEP-CTERM sorting domain-containing protein [Rubellicoccus peritrichatus]|uniref:PEP-CTERM sorting domain-containing protein n=1 Tax=Rubellicoccus peritrichatus TaxID=3080537 RepID=A0AAQ3L864_9BACT|nr:PEP-CTERM sorting domain-containing protein [Puniceicoccus sp. CR14]WOO40866.1 PEP-CTERM sorting domain-containing protein [Puniceicoccus sp. CR14]